MLEELGLYDDSPVKQLWSTTSPWPAGYWSQQVELRIPGTHRLRWTYQFLDGVADDSMQAFLDLLSVAPLRAALAAHRGDAGIAFEVNGDPGWTCVLESSPALGPDSNWQVVRNITLASPTMVFELPVDAETTGAFYRLRMMP